MTYKIIRHYASGDKSRVLSGLSLEEVRAHCHDPESSSRTCTTSAGRTRTKVRGPWFDGYLKEGK